MQYKHTQFGFAVILTLLMIIVFLVMIRTSDPFIGILIVLSAGIWFCTLTISVNTQQIEWYYTFHFLKKKLPISEIKSIKRIKTKWYYGYGTRYLRHGILYNVSGFDAIEIVKNNDEVVMLGTDEPDVLLEVIDKALTYSKKTAGVHLSAKKE